MLQKIGIVLFSIFTLSSCITHKDIVYFQGESIKENKLKEINNKPYRLQVDDILHIDIKAPNEELVQVFKNNTITQNTSQVNQSMYYFSGYSVDKQGFIMIPYLKKINVLGYTTDEVADKIERELGNFFKNLSDIFVSVKLAGIKYTILGEINKPGSNVLFQNNVNIIEAIASAGDIPVTGDKKNIEVLRVGIDGVQKFHIDLTQMQAFNSEIFYIQPNDIINIPPLPQKTLGTGTTGTQTLSTVVSVVSLLTTTYLLFKSL
jgi:polysaccharide export outer membrane protein